MRTWRAGLLLALAGGCSSGGSSLAANAKGPLACAPPSADLGPCCGNVALAVQADKLAVDTCSGSSAYSICDGARFPCEYTCTLPAGYTVQTGTPQRCPPDGGVPEAPSDHPVAFDGGSLRLGSCAGRVVALIPAPACPDRCPGSLAYAVCQGGAYRACACDIPPGYTLTALAEGGVADAKPKAD